MNKAAILSIAAAMLLLAAADPKGFAIWKSQELKGYAAKLSPKINADKIATEKLADYGGYYTQMAHREGSGIAELHERWTDIFVIESGEGTVVVGGTIDGRHESGPGEIRGTAVTGGENHPVKPGDVVHVPANTPHQMLVPKGSQITYFVVKIQNP
jgi:mannose-6-phosphate isomerase-like protein (cupin superfamily)